MRLVLVGAGPVGRAAAMAAANDGVADRIVAVVDPDDRARAEAGAELGAEGFASVADLRPIDLPLHPPR